MHGWHSYGVRVRRDDSLVTDKCSSVFIKLLKNFDLRRNYMDNRELLKRKLRELVLQGQNAGKWSPRKGPKANELRKFMNLTPKAYRKLIVGLTNVVETKMCAGQWDTIEFGKLPSVASSRYQKAFNKRCAERYAEYKAGLVKGTEKINAGAVYPYDIIKSLGYGDLVVAQAQWDALPNFLGDDNNLPMVDVSGSMAGNIASPGLTCMDVAVSLGLYISDKQKGVFKDVILTFSSNPKLTVLKGNLHQKKSQLMQCEWGMSTNLEAAFREVLDTAIRNKVSAEDMPKMITILSDMEFNSCIHNPSNNALNMIKIQYEDAGYILPRIVFWNLNARAGNSPVKHDTDGTALISGFSPAIMKSVLASKTFNPRSIMLDAVMSDRYNWTAA